MNKKTYLKFLVVISFLLVFTACDNNNSRSASGEIPEDLDNPGSTIIANYTKGPVTGAKALLKDASGKTVAGPTATENDGQATFENVTYIGPLYAVFSGGSYTDEATGSTVILDESFEMRSGIVNNSGAGGLVITTTPLTEIGFQRAVMQNGRSANLGAVKNQLEKVADEYGLDKIDLTTVVPTALEYIRGSSDKDRYGAVLAAISQQQLNSNQTPNTASLQNYINNSVNTLDRGALAEAVLGLQTNAVTQSYINTTVINGIISLIGTPGHTIGGSVNGLSDTLVLQNNDGDALTITNNGAFKFPTRLEEKSAYSATIMTQPTGQTCSISNASGILAAVDLDTILVSCRDNVNYVRIGTGGSPIGRFWYIGDGQWERDIYYDLESFTQTGTALDGELIFLSSADGTEKVEINLEELTITYDQGSRVDEVLGFGCLETPESYVVCPLPSTDHTPVITSAAVAEVSSGRATVLRLQASDADLPPPDLSFSLTDNPETDNDLFDITNFTGKTRTACRAGTANQGHPDDINNDQYFIVEEGVSSLKECQEACNQYPLYGSGSALSCKGVEYRIEGSDLQYPEPPRCELWKTSIRATVPEPGYSCYTRQSESPGVLSFINAPDFRIPLDADVNNVYEVEAEVSDGEDGDSSTQIIQVTVIPSGEYIGSPRTACRAGTQNEGHPEDRNNSSYFTITNGVDSLEDCQALCDAYPLIDNPNTNCTGVEYRVEGADYADTTSRCELWKVPIVATTPQKEYACYLRDSVRDNYGPDITAYIGDYKASYIDENGDFATTTMTLSQLSPSKLLWTEGGDSWEVARTADRNKLEVGNDYPYAGDGYEEPEVIWSADEVAGIAGPSGRIYRTDWAHAKFSNSQAVYREYINNQSANLIRVEEAERQIRELKWAIAEQINTAAAYRAYMNDIGDYYGRTQEAERRIGNFQAFVTAEVLQIEVDTDVPAIGEDNDLELFYYLEFTKNWKARADDNVNWSTDSLILESIEQSDGSKITNINDGADRAFKPAGNALKTIEATENETLRYGGLMFEVDAPLNFNKPDCEDFDQSGSCKEPALTIEQFFRNTSTLTSNSTYPLIEGIFDDYHWEKFSQRTWAGNASNASESLDFSYFTVTMEDLEYEVPKVETKSIKFESDEEIRVTYEITKRTEEQHEEYLAANTVHCEDPVLKPGKLQSRSSVAIDPPGFIIRNETDQTYSISLNQVGPLYYGEVRPGTIFVRDTAWGHFTIDAILNLTGEERYSDWDVAVPIAQFTAEVLLTAFTGGSPVTNLKSAINAGVKFGAGKVAASTAARAGASALGRTAFGRSTMRAGAQALKLAAQSNHQVLIKLVRSGGSAAIDQGIDTAFNEAFTQKLVDHIYREDATEEYRTWRYSGAWPDTVGMYHLVGGPRLPCLNSDGDVEIRSNKLEILNDEECANSSICTLH